MRKLLSKPAGPSQPHDGPAFAANATGHHDDHQRLPPRSYSSSTSPVPLLYRPTGPQEAALQVGVPIAALDKSPDGRAAVLAGRHVLKTVRVDRGVRGVEIREAFDLRALITAQSSPRANATASVAEQLAIRDVKWGSGRSDTCIFTACLRGKIFVYDLSHLGGARVGGGLALGGGGGGPGDGHADRVSFVQTQEDSRQINTLDINPHNGAYLLSGSQDGIVRCFDTRKLVASRLGPTFRPMQAFKCNTDVRAVQWSPTGGFYFACCTEQGVVMKWDLRKTASPLLRITAHESACTALSWHPDGEHLISGGVDKKCHVWDVSKTADKRQKPKWTVHAPAPVAAVAWRPGQWSATCQGMRAAQVAVSYDVSGPKRPGINAAHVWDLARPTIPYKTVERFECSPSALLWRDQEFLWTVGEDGLFCQNDVTFAPRVLDRTAVSTLAFSSCGDVLAFLDERPPPPRPRVLASMHKDLPSATAAAAAAAVSSSSYGSSDPSTPTAAPTPALSISLSDSEDDVVRGFLMPRRRTAGSRTRRASSVHHVGSTPSPSSHGAPSSHRSGSVSSVGGGSSIGGGGSHNAASGSSLTVSLEDSLWATGLFRPQQIMAVGHAPAAAHRDLYGYLANVYLTTLSEQLPADPRHTALAAPLPERVAAILDTYARAAADVGHFRLAQVWRVLAFAMDLLLHSRAQYHRACRLDGHGYSSATTEASHLAARDSRIHGPPLPWSEPSGSTLASASLKSDDPVRHSGDGLHGSSARTKRPVRSLLTEEIESTSNMPTPLARPVAGLGFSGSPGEHDLSGSNGDSAYDYLHRSSFDSHGLPTDVESFHLPPSRYQDYRAGDPPRRHSLHPSPPAAAAQRGHGSSMAASHLSSVEAYDIYDTEAMANAIDVPGATVLPPTSAPRPMDYHQSDADDAEHSPVRTPHFHRQDSTDSAAGRIFEISQASGGHALDNTDHRLAAATAAGGRNGGRRRADESLSRSRGRQPVQLEKQPPLLASSASSSRLLRLNRALLAMEFSSGSTPSLSTPGVTRDTYYRADSQGTESSTNSVPPRTGLPRVAGLSQGAPVDAFTSRRPRGPRTASPRQDTNSLPDEDGQDDDGDSLTDRDYLPWPHDPPFPFPGKDGNVAEPHGGAGLDPYVMVERALAFEVQKSPLHASAMVLLLGPLVPDGVVDALQAAAVVRQHHARLMGMQLFLEAALLRKLCVPGWPAQGPRARSQANAALAQWGAGADYTAVVAPAQKNVQASYVCAACKKPRDLEAKDEAAAVAGGGAPGATSSLWHCERCKRTMAPCAVCGHREVAAIDDEPGQPVLSTWWYCVGCGHGGHVSCLESWHAQERASAAAAVAATDGSSSPRIVSSLGHLDLATVAGDSPLSAADVTAAAETADPLVPGPVVMAPPVSSLSDGCCPLDGCGHACLPGPWRAETAAQRSDELAARTAALLPGGTSMGTPPPPPSEADLDAGFAGYNFGSSLVTPDGHEVGPSRAVDVVRESLASVRSELAGPRAGLSSSPGRSSSSVLAASGGSGGSGGSGVGLSLGPGAGYAAPDQGASTVSEPRERERRKSVKFARTDDR